MIIEAIESIKVALLDALPFLYILVVSGLITNIVRIFIKTENKARRKIIIVVVFFIITLVLFLVAYIFLRSMLGHRIPE